jgi:hypothetical protein
MKKPWQLRDRGGICCAKNKEAAAQATAWPGVGRDNAGLNAARLAQHPLADRCRDLTKQIDLAAKLAGRVIDIAVKELRLGTMAMLTRPARRWRWRARMSSRRYG